MYAHIRELFGPKGPSVRDYARALYHRVRAKRAEFIVGLCVSASIGAIGTWLSVKFGITPEQKLGWAMLTVILPTVITVVLFLLWEIAFTAFRLFREQAVSLNSKQLIIEANAAELVLEIETARQASSRREHALRERHLRDANKLRDEIAGLLQREPDVTLEYTSPGAPVLHNYGGPATKIGIDRIITRMDEATFSAVMDLDGNQSSSVQIAISALYAFDPTDKDQSLHWLAKNEARSRAVDEQVKIRDGHANSEVTAEMMRHAGGPVATLRVTYSDRAGSASWEKFETLTYDGRTDTAFIEHGQRNRLPIAASPTPIS